MPIYEYRCLDCNHEFELMQKFSDPPAEVCPSCAGSIQKLISRSAFHLKGDGWYVTDYARNKGGQNGKGSSKDSTETSDSSSDASSETKTSSGTTTSETSKSTSTETTASA